MPDPTPDTAEPEVSTEELSPEEAAEYVRVKDPGSGAEFSYTRGQVAAMGLGDYVIDKDALGPDGRPAPALPRLPLGEPRPGSKVARDRAATQKKTTGASGSGETAGQPSATPAEES